MRNSTNLIFEELKRMGYRQSGLVLTITKPELNDLAFRHFIKTSEGYIKDINLLERKKFVIKVHAGALIDIIDSSITYCGDTRRGHN